MMTAFLSSTTTAVEMVQVDQDVQDDEIVRRVIAGDGKAFAELVDRYGRLALSTVRKHVPPDHVEDTLQEVFLRALRALPSFAHQGGFGQWLSVIAVRTCYDFWREKYKSKELTMSSLSEEQEAWLANSLLLDSEERIQEQGRRREAGEILDRLLNSLSPGDRMVLELVYLEERPLKEACELLGWSMANVKVRLFRARRKLRKMLERSRDIEWLKSKGEEVSDES
jgi:RNA polymerase sigma-70 factor, ECF subfamily